MLASQLGTGGYAKWEMFGYNKKLVNACLPDDVDGLTCSDIDDFMLQTMYAITPDIKNIYD